MKKLVFTTLYLFCIWVAFTAGIFMHNNITENYARQAEDAEKETKAAQAEYAVCREEVRRLVQVSP